MKKILYLISLLVITIGCQPFKKKTPNSFSQEQIIVSEDVTNFWEAYDAIHSTKDSVLQMKYLKTLFLNKASKGQKRMIKARRYTAEEYLRSINTRSNFWNSIRKNTENIEEFNSELREGVDKLAAIYPSLNRSKIYYTIGNHRSPGTGVDNFVLIGTEFALGDSASIVSELPTHNQNYYRINPVSYLQFLTVHEYVHTQQKKMVHDLLSLTLYEGIAEFVAIQATGRQSPWKAFTYGPENEEKIKRKFQEDMFKSNTIYSWLWNSPNNEFQTSELGYFIGFNIASKYYKQAADKKLAIKNLIELDFSNEREVEELVNSTNYFEKSLDELQSDFESKRPKVLSFNEFNNGDKNVDPSIKKVTVNFSEPMDTKSRGFDFGPLGEENVLRVQKIIGFSEDGKSFSFEIELKENQQYQSIITNRFQSAEGIPLEPYLIDLQTKGKVQ